MSCAQQQDHPPGDYCVRGLQPAVLVWECRRRLVTLPRQTGPAFLAAVSRVSRNCDRQHPGASPRRRCGDL